MLCEVNYCMQISHYCIIGIKVYICVKLFNLDYKTESLLGSSTLKFLFHHDQPCTCNNTQCILVTQGQYGDIIFSQNCNNLSMSGICTLNSNKVCDLDGITSWSTEWWTGDVVSVVCLPLQLPVSSQWAVELLNFHIELTLIFTIHQTLSPPEREGFANQIPHPYPNF